jgi:hypothetical protein
MQTDVVKQVAARVGQHPDTAAATEAVSAATFKADVKSAVLAAEMQRLNAQHARATGKSTVTEYLNILGPAVTEFPNQLPCTEGPSSNCCSGQGLLRLPTQLPSAQKPAPRAFSATAAQMRRLSTSPWSARRSRRCGSNF